ncbi:hypothetical protein TNCV_1629171 [Trichonephila clavipes]|uniref:Uncharacterized protein n=1 Tax=Trichonephila clavipes TaxID=2585209 RepID=A0A8X6W9U2_TRICX|nr:hypothetical protein TNCV_1629171 [Trichonephila clavipes]
MSVRATGITCQVQWSDISFFLIWEYHTFLKQKANHCPHFLLIAIELEIDNGAVMLNGFLHSHDYEERRVTRCTELFPTTLHSALDTITVAKPWNEKS